MRGEILRNITSRLHSAASACRHFALYEDAVLFKAQDVPHTNIPSSRNYFYHDRHVIGRFATSLRNVVDALVIGAGAAGLSPSLALGRVLRSAVVFDSDEYRNAFLMDYSKLRVLGHRRPVLIFGSVTEWLSPLDHNEIHRRGNEPNDCRRKKQF